MRYTRYATYRDALDKPDCDADFNRRVDACAECHMGEDYAELCSVHAKEAGWGPYGLAETLMEITPQTHGRTVKFCPRCRTLEPHYVCDPENIPR